MKELLHVLLVDGRREGRDEVRRQLLAGSTRSYDFIEAETGKAAVGLCHANSPDCIVLSCILPDMHARDVLGKLAQPDNFSMYPVVVLTGTDEAGVGREMIRAGAQDFLGKTWMTPESLTRAIENAIERWNMAEELRDREAALRASEERLEVALRATAVIGFTWDVQNDQVIRFHSAEPALPLNPNAPQRVADVRAAVHPDDIVAFDAAVAACLARGRDPSDSIAAPGTPYPGGEWRC